MRRTTPFRLGDSHVLLAAAVLHDVGHGPFSHLFEPALGIKHEHWSCQIIRSSETVVNQKLVENDIPVEHVTALIEEDNHQRPVWQKTLLSSELDVDRLDYLRRDSYFTGSGYGHYDWYRILNSFTLHTTDDGLRILAWPDSAMYSIEEYIFARFYMYRNVYQHKTTRGFEKLVHAAWKRAKQILIHQKKRSRRRIPTTRYLFTRTPSPGRVKSRQRSLGSHRSQAHGKKKFRYYVPCACRDAVRSLAASRKW